MIPYAVDAPFDYRPVVNWLICAILIVAFVFQVKAPIDNVEPFILEGWGILGLIGHNWLHWHVGCLIFNLLFLWPFGNAVCSKVGNKIYPLVYLGFALFGGLVHLIFSDHAAYGPGVAISAVVGMYIVFFPENSITCLFLFPRPVTIYLGGVFFVVMWFIGDLFQAILGVHGEVYVAHILSLVAGGGLAALMLRKKMLVMEKGEKSLLMMLGWDKEAAEGEKEKKESEEKPEEGKGPEEEKVLKKQGRGAEGPVAEGHKEPAGPVETVVEAEETKTGRVKDDEFIRFYCKCGKRIKVPKKYAGQLGHCPRCHEQVTVPET